MSVQLRTIALTSDEILQELITDSLPHILGESCEVITHDLPFEGRHMLCLDADRHPTVVAYDGRDGGRALLAGLAVIEGLCDNRGMLYRLYPALFRGEPRHTGAIFRSEDLRLVVLAPRALPGVSYLKQAFPALTARIFRTLDVDGSIGLLIEDAPHDVASTPAAGDGPRPLAPFRSGVPREAELTVQEARYFDGT
jgi:hypothetical protein